MPILALGIMKGGLQIRLQKFQSSNKATVVARCFSRLVLAGEKSCSSGHFVGFPLRLHMLSSAPSELPKERARAGD